MTPSEKPPAGAPFMMDPVPTIVALARTFVDQQRTIVRLRGMLDDMPASADKDALREQLAATELDWTSTQLPNLAASFQLALEVLATNGPSRLEVHDETDALS